MSNFLKLQISSHDKQVSDDAESPNSLEQSPAIKLMRQKTSIGTSLCDNDMLVSKHEEAEEEKHQMAIA